MAIETIGATTSQLVTTNARGFELVEGGSFTGRYSLKNCGSGDNKGYQFYAPKSSGKTQLVSPDKKRVVSFDSYLTGSTTTNMISGELPADPGWSQGILVNPAEDGFNGWTIYSRQTGIGGFSTMEQDVGDWFGWVEFDGKVYAVVDDNYGIRGDRYQVREYSSITDTSGGTVVLATTEPISHIATNGTSLLVSCRDGVIFTTQDFVSWTQVQIGGTGQGDNLVAGFYINGNNAYVTQYRDSAGAYKFYYSTSQGLLWSEIAIGGDATPPRIARIFKKDPLGSGTTLICTDGNHGAQISTDDGLTWTYDNDYFNNGAGSSPDVTMFVGNDTVGYLANNSISGQSNATHGGYLYSPTGDANTWTNYNWTVGGWDGYAVGGATSSNGYSQYRDYGKTDGSSGSYSFRDRIYRGRPEFVWFDGTYFYLGLEGFDNPINFDYAIMRTTDPTSDKSWLFVPELMGEYYNGVYGWASSTTEAMRLKFDFANNKFWFKSNDDPNGDREMYIDFNDLEMASTRVATTISIYSKGIGAVLS